MDEHLVVVVQWVVVIVLAEVEATQETPTPMRIWTLILMRAWRKIGIVVPVARKRLVNADGTFTERTGSSRFPPAGFVSDKVMLETSTSEILDKSQMSTPQKVGNTSIPNVISATPFEGDRREQ